MGPGTSMSFSLRIVGILYGRPKADEISKGLVHEFTTVDKNKPKRVRRQAPKFIHEKGVGNSKTDLKSFDEETVPPKDDIIGTGFDPVEAISIKGKKYAGMIAGVVELEVVQGDIVKESTDAIVNAANDGLNHDGGVAAAISNAGGPAIRIESDAHT